MSKVKLVGKNSQTPSAWKQLSGWNLADIPPYPGTYEICYAPGGTPVALNLQSDDPSFAPTPHARCDDLEGVIYVGKALCFRDRFWTLIKTWRRVTAGHTANHGSYDTWLTKGLQNVYPIGDLLFRYMPIGKEVWKPKLKTRVDELRAALLDQDGHSGDDMTSIAAYSAENILLRRYFCCFGTKPPLNTMGPWIGALTDDFIASVIEDLGKSDDEIHPDDEVQIRSLENSGMGDGK
jgi:hypothetical protein